MRFGAKLPSSSKYFNKEVALNELLEGGSGLSTATITSVADSDSAQTLLAANVDRKACVIFNDSAEILYVALGATATTSAFTYRVTPNATLELYGEKNFTGIISGIWAANGSGSARITELEP